MNNFGFLYVRVARLRALLYVHRPRLFLHSANAHWLSYVSDVDGHMFRPIVCIGA